MFSLLIGVGALFLAMIASAIIGPVAAPLPRGRQRARANDAYDHALALRLPTGARVHVVEVARSALAPRLASSRMWRWITSPRGSL